jgi:hypothetical protein
MARSRCGLRAQRIGQPVSQQAAACGGAAAVEQRKKRRRALAAQRFGDLQIAPCREVQRKVIGAAFNRQRTDMRKRRLLRRLRVIEQRPRGSNRKRRIIGAESGQVAGAELGAQTAHPGSALEPPRRQRAHRRAGAGGRRAVLGMQYFAGIDAREQRFDLRQRHIPQVQAAPGEIEPCNPGPRRRRMERDQKTVPLAVEESCVDYGARRHHAGDLALDRPFACGRIADLLANGDRMSQTYQLRQILLERVVRDAGHRDRRPGRLAARRQGDIEQWRRALRIAIEELVKIAHAVKNEPVRVLALDAQILLHHRRVCRVGPGGRCRSGWRQFVVHERAADRPNRL